MAVISLLLFVAVIVLGIITKKNIGIIGLAVASVFGFFFVGMSAKEIYVAGWPTYVFFVIIASTLLFGVANVNGTTEAITKNVMYYCRGKVRGLPFVFGAVGGVLSAAGGSCFVLLIVMPIALSVAIASGLDVLMTDLIVMCLIMAGSISPLVVNGIVAKALSAEQGAINYTPMWAAYAVSMILFSVLIWIVFKGWKLGKSENTVAFLEKPAPFNKMQKLTLAVIAVVIIILVTFKYDVGLVCVVFAALLLIFNAADQKKVILSIPWNTLFLICGMGVFINVVVAAGGFQLLQDAMSNILNEKNAQPVMTVLSGLMGAVSSTTGVVMPTMFPLAGELAAGNSSLDLYAMCVGIVVGTHGVVISPLSSIGAMCIGCTPEGSVNPNRMFNVLLIAAIVFTVLATAASALGIYGLFY